MLGILGVQILFQSIVGGALLLKAKRVARDEGLALRSPAVAE
jgi:hypothetical protein